MTANEQIAQDIEAALAILDRDGWCKGAPKNRQGEHCMYGALLEASCQRHRTTWDEMRLHALGDLWNGKVWSYAFRMAKMMDMAAGSTMHPLIAKMTNFNDRAATKYEDVRELMKRKADEIRGMD